MKVTKIKVNLGATINLGNFESLRLDYEMEAELDQGETPNASLIKLRDNLAENMVQTLRETNGGKDLLKKK